MLVHAVVEGLVAVLRVQHEVLDGLEHRLVAAHALLAAGEPHRLGHGAADVQAAAAAVREHDAHRARVAGATARALGLPATAPLRRLAAVAPEPLATLLGEDADGLQLRLDVIDAVAADVRLGAEIGLFVDGAPRRRPELEHERWGRHRAVLGHRALRLAATALPLAPLRAFCA